MGPVSQVFSYSGHLSDLEISSEDVAEVLIKFTSGAVAGVHLDYLQRAYSRTLKLIGDRGTFTWDYSAGEARIFSAQTKTWSTHANPPGWEPNQMYLDELRHFVDCLDGTATPMQDLFEAAQSLRLALAARESSATGRVIYLGHLGAQHG
jgi:predicted dehydrogenase